MAVRLAGNSIFVKASQSANAPCLVPTSDDQFPSQYPSIVFNLELGSKVTDDSCEQFLNVPTPIFSTLAGI